MKTLVLMLLLSGSGHARWTGSRGGASPSIDFALEGDIRRARIDALHQALSYCEGRLHPKVLDLKARTVHYACKPRPESP